MKNFTKNLMLLLLILTAVVTASSSFAQSQAPATRKTDVKPLIPTMPFTYNGKTYDVTVQWINLNDPTIRVDLSLADEKIGATATLEALSKPKNPGETTVASINGSFFNMVPDSQPVSTLLMDGQYRHVGGTGSVVGFDGNNKMHIERLGLKIEGAINDQWEPPYSFSPWNINHYFDKPDASMIFDNAYTGKFPPAPLTAVAVERGEVVGVYDSIPKIPTHGYIIVTRTTNMQKLVKVGDTISYRFKSYQVNDDRSFGKEINDFKGIRTAVGAGPTLVKNGVKVLNPRAEGFTISKLISGAAVRSMIGTTADNRMAMVTTPAMSPDALAELAIHLGLTQAINLDGGQSTGMMMGSQYAVKPGRQISNAIVVTKIKAQPYRLTLNGEEQFFPVEPYIQSNRTMVPLRRILEMLGCQVSWEDATQSVVVKRYQDTLKLQIGDRNVYVNGRQYTMDVPLTLKDSNTFISVRFLTEFFGGAVTWEPKTQMVGLTLPTVENYYNQATALFKSGDYFKALDIFDKVLKLHPRHVSALRQSASIYENSLSDLRSATSYYERAIAIFSSDYETLIKLGQLYTKLEAYDKAQKVYETARQVRPSGDDAAFGLAKLLVASKPDEAKVLFEWIKVNSKNAFYISEAKAYLGGI